jgi:hypothetical protein
MGILSGHHQEVAMNRGYALCVSVLILVLSDAVALPRFAVRTGAKCQSCHINPSGGAMRQAFGAEYGREKLPVPAWSNSFELEDFTTLLTNVMGVGADFRTLYYYQQLPDTNGRGNRNAFFQMQGDLYLNFRLAKKVNIFLKKGLYSGFEAFGLLTILPANGHVKVGKFVPNFGTKIDDHTAYIRTVTGFSPETGRPELTGAEVGVSPGRFSVVGGIYNAHDGFAGSGGNNKAILGRAEGMFELGEDLHCGLGADIFTKENDAGVRSSVYGGFGSFSYHNISIFGELDILRSSGSIATVTGLVSYIEGSYLVTPGLDLKLTYDFYDPDRDFKTGSQSRISVGCEFFPIAGVELRPMYRFNIEDPTDQRNNELHLLLHFYL